MSLTAKPNRWIKLAIAITCCLIGGIVAIGADIYRFASESDPSPADAAIVLGAAVWDEQPSPVFAERIKHAIHLYQTGKVRYLIFTGGVGTQDQLAESVVASRYAIARGVSTNDTWCETTSRITWENLQGAKQIIDNQHLNRVLIVSDPLHMRRSVVMARDLGLSAYSSPTPTTRYISVQSKTAFLLRETYFYTLYLIQRPFIPVTGTPQKMQVQPCPLR
ncbi:MAG TPA: YdcF family protein [Crinalium sp.]|jgi:uncharacterized SAM-binding protein YcdF (DUF218 family)